MIPGIDFVGTVPDSAHDGITAGDAVVLNGWGVGETHLGGYAQRARVPGEWLVPLPEAFTAGAVDGHRHRRLHRGAVRAGPRAPRRHARTAGPSWSPAPPAASAAWPWRCWPPPASRCIASTGKADEAGYLKDLGAGDVIDRVKLSEPGRPMGKERWGGAVDSVGSHTLANVLAGTRYGGTVAACGLAQGMDLPGSVAPFILRGVTLAGVDSVMAPMAARRDAWARLARDLDPSKLDTITETRPVADAPALAEDILAGKIRGRVVLTVA